MSESIQVAVRVRPFASYEKQKGAKNIVTMHGGTQTIVNNPSSGKPKSFTFDFSFNSHVEKTHPDYASNDDVYNKLGVQVLDNAWDGFNCCLFAYGQTGSGKSYSMMGYGEDYGIIPRAVRTIFDRINDAKADGKTYHVECSMLEIYNEQIRDLFSSVPRNKLQKGGLKVRDSASTGPFVAGLTKNAVETYKDVEKLMDLGVAARTVAATNMNATSSRAHTVFTVILTQQEKSNTTGKVMKKTSKINLVDLAGSERANATGATGDRLKEGCAINQSLSSLGNVINALAKQSEGVSSSKRKKKGMKSGKIVVPYRASKLTHLLKQSLGGNSKTIMIAAVSPADVNYKETLGTLQYADRAKQIKNKAVVNEDPTEKMIRGLREELENLKKKLKLQEANNTNTVQQTQNINSDGASEKEMQELKLKYQEERDIEMNELKEQMLENERLMKEQAKTWEERLKETEMAAKEQVKQLSKAGITTALQGEDRKILEEKKQSVPHLFNLNEDPLMSGIVVYFLDQRVTRIGRTDATAHEQHICLSGLSIASEHATITYDEEGGGANSITIMPVNKNAKVTINGKKIVGSVPLHHNWRVIIGNNHVFRFVHPVEKERKIQLEATLNDSRREGKEGKEKICTTDTEGKEGKEGKEEKEEKEGQQQEEEIFREKDVDLQYDYAFAMREINEAAMEALTSGERQAREVAEREAKEMEAKVKSLEIEMNHEKKRAEKEAKVQDEKFQKHQEKLEAELKTKEEELRDATFTEGHGEEELLKLRQEQSKRRKDFEIKRDQLIAQQKKSEMELQIQIEKALQQQREKEDERRRRRELDRKLVETIPLINEGNAIADELNKPTIFAIKLVANNSYSRSCSQQSLSHSRASSGLAGSIHRARASIVDSDIQVAVMFTDNSQPMILWDFEKFESRLFLMRELYNDWAIDRDMNRLLLTTKDKDPFWDPPESRLIGTAVLYLDSLSFLLEIEETTPIIDFKGKQVGELTCELIALSIGNKNLIDNFEEFQLKNFIGQNLKLEMRMIGARGLPSSLCNDVEARWVFWDHAQTCTKQIKGPTIAPDFEHITQVVVDVDSHFVQYVQNDSLEVEIWGKPTQKGFGNDSSGSDSSGANGKGNLPKTVPELQSALEKERKKRKLAENRIAELELTDGNGSSVSAEVESLKNEVASLKKKLAEQPKSGVCAVQ